MDTASRRASAINISCPWRGLGPVPDGTLGAGDRSFIAFLYSFTPEAPAEPAQIGARIVGGQFSRGRWRSMQEAKREEAERKRRKREQEEADEKRRQEIAAAARVLTIAREANARKEQAMTGLARQRAADLQRAAAMQSWQSRVVSMNKKTKAAAAAAEEDEDDEFIAMILDSD